MFFSKCAAPYVFQMVPFQSSSISEGHSSVKGASLRLEIDVARRSASGASEAAVVLHLADGKQLRFSASALDDFAKELDRIVINMSKCERVS
ncbi:hypothetical protein QR680_017426 [Steinernema hermaphroditum]|uniref:Uncharacterized protein n=1 Tax=Steinernema hermaphroditum TaxID=289476 RepID=A0AA39LNZ7_9BILA|nr:hypothetical protein QR680_017426 [Steinernema hermaphroditum]